MKFKYKANNGKTYTGFIPVIHPTDVDPLAIFVTVWLEGDFHEHYNVDGDEGLKNLLDSYKDHYGPKAVVGKDLFYRAFHPI